jgi:hypothetical protein
MAKKETLTVYGIFDTLVASAPVEAVFMIEILAFKATQAFD